MSGGCGTLHNAKDGWDERTYPEPRVRVSRLFVPPNCVVSKPLDCLHSFQSPLTFSVPWSPQHAQAAGGQAAGNRRSESAEAQRGSGRGTPTMGGALPPCSLENPGNAREEENSSVEMTCSQPGSPSFLWPSPAVKLQS